jgi:SPP1 gp7 family putative phage head morphogenesis protein
MPLSPIHSHNAGSRPDPFRIDPTGTGLARRQFQAEIVRRFNLLKKDVWDFLITLDALGLRSPTGTPEGLFRGGFRITKRHIESQRGNFAVLARPQPREFQFRTSPAKVKAFREWLEEQIDARILSPKEGADPNKPWTFKYIESAYKKGKNNAYIRSRRRQAVMDERSFDAGLENFLKDSFNAGEMTSKIELLSTRSFEQLRGVSSQMGQQMNRILAQGMADGKGVMEIAREMSRTISGMSKNRARVIARTEIINAHAEGSLDGMEALGVEDVGVLAEWSTAGDGRVCPRCSAMEGKKYKIKDARGLIPIHPQCRCAWVPYVPLPGEKRAKPSKRPKG